MTVHLLDYVLQIANHPRLFLHMFSDGSKFHHKIKDNVFFSTVKADADVSMEVIIVYGSD